MVLFRLGLCRLERRRRLVEVEGDGERHCQTKHDADSHADDETAAGAFARARGSCLCAHIFSGALTPISDSPLASVWRTAAQSARRATRSSSSSTRMRSAL